MSQPTENNSNGSVFTENISISPIFRFLCWCSGARMYLLLKCPTEYNKFLGIGTIVFFTGILAFISGSYALGTIFGDKLVAIAFGLFWGTLIFFLDWYIVASIRKEDKKYKEWATALPRLILSVFLALVITKPLELKLFEKEINQEIINLQADKNMNSNEKIMQQFALIDKLSQEISSLKNETQNYETRRNQLYNAVIAEAEGQSVTQLRGKGPVFREKNREFEKADQAYQQILLANNKAIAEKQERIKKLSEQRDKRLNENLAATENYEGMLARLQALNSLAQRNKAINVANWFVVLLFIVLESSPVLVKLMARKGPYDYLLEVSEYRENSRYEFEKLLLKQQHEENFIEKIEQKEKETGIKNSIIEDHYNTIKSTVQKLNNDYADTLESTMRSDLKKGGKFQQIIDKITFPRFS